MHFFKYGKDPQVLAIVVPPRVQKNSGITESDDYEFLEIIPGAFLLVDAKAINNKVELLGKIAEKLFSGSLAATTSQKSVTATSGSYSTTPSNAQKRPAEMTKSPPSSFKPSSPGEWEKKLETQGFLVVTDEITAKEASQQLEFQVKHGDVLGVRGFDKKFYIASRTFYESAAAKIMAAPLEKEFTCEQAAAMAKLDGVACTAILQIMKETGEAIEKKRGLYKLVK